MAAEIIDYAIGYGLSEQVIGKWVKRKRLNKAHRQIDRWGGLVIFFFNITPLSSSIISLVAGIVRYRPKRALIYTILGLSIKYAVLIGAVLYIL